MSQICALLLTLLLFLPAWGQTLAEVDKLIHDHDLPGASEAVEKLLQAEPDNHEVLKRLGFVLLLKSRVAKDAKQGQALRKQAREALVRAQKLGNNDELLLSLINGIPEDGGDLPDLSERSEAEKALAAGEDAFAKKDFATAATFYARAAELDPKLYRAPLYHGDAFLHQGKILEACEMYERATQIDPNIETAHRYWGNALLRTGSLEEALEHYAAAVVAEPTSKMAWNRGLARWTKATGATIEIPEVRMRSSVKDDGKTIVVDPEAAAPWFMYGGTRALWRAEEFAKRYPGQEYRHSLAEETAALEAVAEVADELAEKGELAPDADLDLLRELKREGLMEAFVFYSRPSREIFQDYDSYRSKNRDKLIRFMVDYVVRRDQL